MHIQILIPLATILAISPIAYVGARTNRENSQYPDTFVLDPRFGHFLIAGGLLVSVFPLLLSFIGRTMPLDKYLLLVVPASLYPIVVAVWYFCYRIVVTDTSIVVFALRPRTVLFADVVDWGVIRGGGTRDLVMYLRSGPRLRIAGHAIKDFNQLVDLVTVRMAPLPAAQPGQSEQFQKLAKRAQSTRALAWILLVGFALLALLLIVITDLS